MQLHDDKNWDQMKSQNLESVYIFGWSQLSNYESFIHWNVDNLSPLHYHLQVQANPKKKLYKKSDLWEKRDYPIIFFEILT